jgi:hypothetical protein
MVEFKVTPSGEAYLWESILDCGDLLRLRLIVESISLWACFASALASLFRPNLNIVQVILQGIFALMSSGLRQI